MGKSVRLIVTVLASVALLGAACGDDDGADVRETGAATGSGSASATGSASGSATGSASGSHAVSGECNVVEGTEEAAAGEIHATVDEFTIALDKTSVAAGAIKFEAMNEGEEPHEIAIVRGKDPKTLPTNEDGSANDEEVLVGEIEPFASGQECQGTFELAAGDYVVLCNIVEEHEGETEAHFAEGMYTTLTVTG